MARSTARISFFSTLRKAPLLLCLLGLAGAGCKGGADPSAGLPRPNFEGPIVMATPVEAPKFTRGHPVPAAVKRVDNVPAAWIPLADAPKRGWKWIVIHHSATPVGGAKRFDRDHKAKGWDGLGYHFVIGNGTDTPDGLVEVGERWSTQKHGAHAKTPDNQYNDYGIGICLVGNFEQTRPTVKQMASLTKLVAFLADKHGVSQSHIIGHKDTGKQTDCPGRLTDISAIRAAVARQRTALARDGAGDTASASRELIRK